MDFRWNPWNVEHIGDHGVDPDEAEDVARAAIRPYPRRIGDDKWLVWGPGRGGRLLQVVFMMDGDGTAFVIHARPLTDREKRLLRRKGR
jgi:uncharacterized DUF497 family protein